MKPSPRLPLSPSPRPGRRYVTPAVKEHRESLVSVDRVDVMLD